MLTLFMGIHIYLFVTMLYKLWVSYKALTVKAANPPEYTGPLPKYTVIVPLYKEAGIAPRLIERLKKLDYPKSKLQVLLAIEPDDQETLEAFDGIVLPKNFQIVPVTLGKHRTKPHACNCALQYATGELVTIYDAEDAPEPDQLRKAVNLFAASGGKVVCLQAKLNFYNHSENLLTRFFALEYGAWFQYYIKGITLSGFSTPLGGTSNHFKIDALKSLGGWEASSVTEDVELGMKIADAGYDVKHLDSTTWEESPVELSQWIKQRTRWQMGYLLTWASYAFRKPKNWKSFGTLHLFVLANPLNSLLFLPLMYVFLAYMTGFLTFSWSPFWSILGWFLVVAGNVSVLLLHLLGGLKMGFKFWPLVFLLPFYWVLHAVASYRAIYRIIIGKSKVWEKTPHGVSKTEEEHV